MTNQNKSLKLKRTIIIGVLDIICICLAFATALWLK